MSRSSRTRAQRGFSLIELMVALILGLIVVGGLIQVLIANRKAYQLQEGSNYLQQNLRFATDRIGWSLRMADFWGGAEGAAITGISAGEGAVTAKGGDCTKAWIVDTSPDTDGGGGVFGYDGGTTFPLGSGCVPDSDYVKGSDVLVVRYADAEGVDPAAASTIGALTSPVHIVAAVGRRAEMFAGTTVPQTSVSPPPRQYVFAYRIEAYYLQPCSDRGSDDHCDAGDDDGAPVPTLMRLRLDSGGNLVREPIVGGIEQLQFEYALRGSGGEHVFPAQYVTATQVDAQWASVIAVRVSMVSRSNQRDVAVPHPGTYALSSGCSYSIAAGGGFTGPASSGSAPGDCTGFSLSSLHRPDQFPRVLTQQVVQVRNRIRG